MRNPTGRARTSALSGSPEDSESDGAEAPPSQAESAAKHAAAHNVIELLVFMRINYSGGRRRIALTALLARGECGGKRKKSEYRSQRGGFRDGIGEGSGAPRGAVQEKFPAESVSGGVVGGENFVRVKVVRKVPEIEYHYVVGGKVFVGKHDFTESAATESVSADIFPE